jgi:glycosyltransferase involved in cell wall biosynthesis
MAITNMDKPADITQYVNDPYITNLMYLIWQSRKDLQQAFNIQTQKGQNEYIYWCNASLQREYGIEFSDIKRNASSSLRSYIQFENHHKNICIAYKHRMQLESLLAKSSKWLPTGVRNKAKCLWNRMIAKSGRYINVADKELLSSANDSTNDDCQFHGSPGVNMIGYVHAELGMGEHVRMSSMALSQTDVPFGVVNFNVGVASRQNASLENGVLINTNKHTVNLFHINADAMIIGFTRLGRAFFENRYNIGYWAWELAKCPEDWVPVFGLVDEIWAPSRFIQNAFQEKTNLPVTYMPLCVSLPQIPNYSRQSFGLPINSFLFLFTFDFFSYIHRKNPFAIIKAFQKAFPQQTKHVGLVIKVMNGNEKNSDWKKMLNLIDGDPRIYIINRTIDRSEVLGLFKVCDCFVSLHRSEGFGRGPAEAMYLGKPVIVTNYSGNTDFTLPDNSCLVNFQLIPVEEGQYVFEKGQEWADPDIDHAMWYMKKLVADPEYCRNIGSNGSHYIRTHFDPKTIGNMYYKRLHELELV